MSETSNLYTTLFTLFSTQLLAVVIAIIAIYHACCYAYNLFFHPLRKFPGPRLWAISRIPHELAFCRGRIHVVLRNLHAQYGDVVRIGPNSLSFIHPDAWNDIYGRQTSQSHPFRQDPLRHTDDLWVNGAPDVWTAPENVHPRLRRALAPLFSDKALKGYQPAIIQHADQFIAALEQLSSEKGPSQGKVDVSTWLSFLMYDVVGDLAFGEPFGCVELGKYHPLLARIVESTRAIVVVGAIRQFPWVSRVVEKLIRPIVDKALREQAELGIDKVERRLSGRKDKSDFLEVLISNEGQSDGLTRAELYPNATFLMLAGSETSATVMSGALYHLCANSEAQRAVVEEVRSKFASTEDITFEALRDLPILTAALDESMRMYPGALYAPRVVPRGGASVAGNYVPQGTTVSIYQSVAYLSAINFKDPFTYDPNRFLGDPKYVSDRKDVFRPFSVGPKNCLGYKLAYFQTKLILASLILQFDFELCAESARWTEQDVYLLPDRRPLMVKMQRARK